MSDGTILFVREKSSLLFTIPWLLSMEGGSKEGPLQRGVGCKGGRLRDSGEGWWRPCVEKHLLDGGRPWT